MTDRGPELVADRSLPEATNGPNKSEKTSAKREKNKSRIVSRKASLISAIICFLALIALGVGLGISLGVKRHRSRFVHFVIIPSIIKLTCIASHYQHQPNLPCLHHLSIAYSMTPLSPLPYSRTVNDTCSSKTTMERFAKQSVVHRQTSGRHHLLFLSFQMPKIIRHWQSLYKTVIL